MQSRLTEIIHIPSIIVYRSMFMFPLLEDLLTYTIILPAYLAHKYSKQIFFYRPRELSEELDRFMSRQEWSAQVKIVGPIAMILGTIMLLIGLTFCCLGWKVSQDEQKRMNSISPNSTTISNVSK